MSGFILHMMRHGAPVQQGLLLGRTDMASSQAGLDACEVMAGRLSFGAVISSPLSRAREAAARIAGARGLSLTEDVRWCELDFGRWDGRSNDAVRAEDAEALQRFYDDPDCAPPPGGERRAELLRRVDAALQEIAPSEAHDASHGPVLVVAHGGSIRAAMALLCGLDYRQSWMIDLPYAAVLTMHVYPMQKGVLAGQIVALSRPAP